MIRPACTIALRILATALAIGSIGVASSPGESAEAAAPSAFASVTGPAQALEETLRIRYPAVKALLIRRADCPMFTYYGAGVDADTRLPLHSMTKSVLSALIGIAQAEGHLGFEQRLADVLPESLDAGADPRVRTITIRHLLTMTAGLDAEAKPKSDLPPSELWRWSLRRPMLSPPGRAFRYDNYGANLLSVLLTRQTGQTAEALARRSLFEPLDIRNTSWTDDGDGHSLGAYGLWLTAPDMAKIGALYLRHGRSAGRQVVPEAFVAAATRRQNAGGTPFRGAYGFLWWNKPTDTGLDAFFAAGSDGQAIYVVPKLDLVVVLASGATPAGGSIGFVNEVVLPAAARLRPCSGVPPG